MNEFIDLSLIILLATGLSFLMRWLKQPLIIGYIITGVIAGPFLFNLIQSYDTVQLFSKIGIMMLLFIVGLGLRPQALKQVGKISLVTGIGQVLFTSLVGYGIVRWLGFDPLSSLYIAIALTFSSTIIILKLLSDKGDVHKLYGQIAIGFLLVQDIIATLILIFISTATSGQQLSLEQLVGLTALKGAGLTVLVYSLSRWLLPRLTHAAAKSQELLFLLSLGWGLSIAALFHVAHFSVEIGALIAGIAFASSPYATEVSSRLKPLRDFFIVLFFVLLGAQMNIGNIVPQIPAALVLSLFVLVGNPLIVYALMTRLGYTSRVSFKAGLTVAQISEFSLILVALGLQVGQIPQSVVSLVTMVGILTIAGSTYMILYSEPLYQRFAKLFRVKQPRQDRIDDENAAILFGYHRVGEEFLKTLQRKGFEVTVVDFNPNVIERLEQQGIESRYGDATDAEFLNEIGADSAKMIVSTLPDYDSNLLLVKTVRQQNKRSVIIVLSHTVAHSLELYKHGASYVLMPHHLGAEFATDMIRKFGLDHAKYERTRTQHLAALRERKT